MKKISIITLLLCITLYSGIGPFPGGSSSGGGGGSIPTPVSIPNGGTGQTTAQAAIDALLPSQASANGKYLTSDGTNASWASVGSGITSINSDSTASQTLTVGTTGTDFAIVDNASGGHAFNLPDAGASARGAVTTGTQTFAGAKTFSSSPTVPATGLYLNTSGYSIYQSTAAINISVNHGSQPHWQFQQDTLYGQYPNAGSNISLGTAFADSKTSNIYAASGTSTNSGISLALAGGDYTGTGGHFAGDLNLRAGNNTNAGESTNGGSVTISGGTVAGSGTAGNITLKTAGSTRVTVAASGAVAVAKGFTSGVATLTDGATPALDASLGNTFLLTAAGDRTIGVPSNPVSGQKIVIAHTASGADRTLALNTGAGGFRFGTDITGLTATTSGKTDYIGAIYNASASFWDVVAYTKGF